MSFKKAETYWIAEYEDAKAKNKEGKEYDVIRRYWKLRPGHVPTNPPGEIRFPIYLAPLIVSEVESRKLTYGENQVYFLTSSQLKPILSNATSGILDCQVKNVMDSTGEMVEELKYKKLTKDAAWREFYKAQSNGCWYAVQKREWVLELAQEFDFRVKSEYELKDKSSKKDAGGDALKMESEKLSQDTGKPDHIGDIQEFEKVIKKPKNSDQELGGGVGSDGMNEEIVADIQNGEGGSDHEPELMETEEPKTEIKINGKKKKKGKKKGKASEKTQGGATGLLTFTGVRFNMAPDPKDHPITEKHFRLRPDHLQRIYANGGREQPHAAYIDMVTRSDMGKIGFPWEKGVPYRDEIGMLKYIKMYKHEALKNASLWEEWYDQATLGTDKGSWKTRYTDPEIKLTIVPVGGGRLKSEELVTIFKEAVQDTNQECEIAENAILGQILLGISPFNDYATYIDPGIYKQYLKCRGDRPMPDTKDKVETACKKLKGHEDRQYGPEVVTALISAEKIKHARGKRADLPSDLKDQGKLMGGSAAKIAGSLEWPGGKARVPAARDDTIKDENGDKEGVVWPPTGTFASEWLHRCAFSWGGIGEDLDYESSQTPENLVFGTSETNSLMTRFETAWQHLIIAEDAYCKNKVNGKVVKGQLTTKSHGVNRNRNTLDSDGTVKVETDKWEGGEPNDDNDWRNQAKAAKASWLCYALEYTMELEFESNIIYPSAQVFKTVFYPFQRPFFTAAEAAADKAILRALIVKAGLELNEVEDENLEEVKEGEQADSSEDIQLKKAGEVGSFEERVLVGNEDGEQFEEEKDGSFQEIGTSKDDSDEEFGDSFLQETTYNKVEKLSYSQILEDEPAHLLSEVNQSNMQDPDGWVVRDGTVEISIDRDRSEERVLYARRPPTPDSMIEQPNERSPKSSRLDSPRRTSPPLASHDKQPPAYEKLWSSVMSGADKVNLNGMVVNKPQLAGMDTQGNIVRIEPEMVGVCEKGRAVLLEESIINATTEEQTGAAEIVVEPVASEFLISGIQESTAEIVVESVVSELLVSGIQASTGEMTVQSVASGLSVSGIQAPTIQTTSITTTVVTSTVLEKQKESFTKPTDSAIPKPPPEFTFTGHIKLFGHLDVDFYSSHGSSVKGTSERVAVTTELSLGFLLPSFVKTPFDLIKLSNTTLTYRSVRTASQPPGLMISTEVRLDGALDCVNDVLRNVFGQKDPCINVTGMLSMNRDWTELLSPIGFTLRSELRNMSMKLFNDAVEIVNLGVDVMGTRTMKQTDTGEVKCGYDMGIGFFGAAMMSVGSGAPMKASWYLLKMKDMYGMTIKLEDDEWKDIFGIEALDLQDVIFNVSFSSLVGLSSMSLRVQATLKIRSGTIVLAGHYSKSDWSLSGHLNNVSLTTLAHMYEDFFGSPLLSSDQKYDIHFNSISLVISSKGFFLQGAVTVNGHTSYAARISIAKQGIEIGGAVGDLTVLDGLVTIHGAALDVFIGPSGRGAGAREIKVAVSGIVRVKDVKIKAGIYYRRTPEGENEYTVYGEVQGDLKLRELAPDLENTFLDISIRKVALIASNQDKPSVDTVNTFSYPVKKGLQVCATIDNLSQIKDLTKKEATGLVLSAAWCPGDSFEFSIIYPSEGGIKFSESVSAGPLVLGVKVKPQPMIFIEAGLIVKVAKQTDPLKFKLALEAGMINARGAAFMKNMWKDPFGLGDDISVGKLVLDIELTYTKFASTGVIDNFTFGGRLQVGSSSGELLLHVSTTRPDEQLISAKFLNFDFSKILVFVARRVGFQLDLPPDYKLLEFKELSLYLSTGCKLYEKNYPAGVSFKADMVLFEHKAVVEAVIAAGTFKIYGTIDSFEIGKLQVHGPNGSSPTIHIEFSSGTQIIKIKGGVFVEGIEASIDLDMEMLPKTVFHFDLKVDFLAAFKLTFNAHMVEGAKGNPKDMDFTLKAVMENNILDELVRGANQHLAENSGNKEQELQDAVAAAQSRVQKAETAFQNLEQHVNKDHKTEKGLVDTELKRLAALKEATQDAYDSMVGDLEGKLKAAEFEKLEAILKQKEINHEENRKEQERLENLVCERDRISNEMDMQWGWVRERVKKRDEELKLAELVLQCANTEIYQQERVVERSSFWENFSERPKLHHLYLSRTILIEGVELAKRLYFAAEELTTDPGYRSAQQAIQDSREAVRKRRQTAAQKEKEMRNELADLTRRKEKGIEDAAKAFREFKTSSDLKTAAKSAAAELDAYKSTPHNRLEAAQKALRDLPISPEAKERDAAYKVKNEAEAALKAYEPVWEMFKTAAAVGAVLFKEQIRAAMHINIRKASIEGSLKEIRSGRPLKARIELEVFGHRIPEMEVDYYFGDTDKFLISLWDEIKNFVLGD